MKGGCQAAFGAQIFYNRSYSYEGLRDSIV